MLKRFVSKFKQKDEHIEEPNLQVEETVENISVEISRDAYNYPKFSKAYSVDVFAGFNLIIYLKEFYKKNFQLSKKCAKNALYKRVPCLKWLQTYSLKENLVADLLAGVAVAIVHVPQSMGYAVLATLAPIYGLYTSFFPVLIYWIFGTSKQISIGTFAVVSLMVADNLAQMEPKYVPPIDFNYTKYQQNLEANVTNPVDASNFLSMNRDQARLMIVMAHSFWVGVIQMVFFFLQLGFLTNYLSEPLLNGFLNGAAVHVFTSQLKFLFGVKLIPYAGILKIPRSYVNFFASIGSFGIPSMIISAICVTVLLVVKIHVNERFHHKMPVPFPTEILIVGFGTLISYFAKLETVYHVSTIGPIPAGIPGPSVPPLFIIKDMILSSFLTAVVSYAINFSLADLFSKQNKYKINSSQEFFAYGASNIFASFFPCFCSGGSLARSCVQNDAGGKTQVVSWVSCVLLAIVLCFIAPLFQQLPMACLASIIVVALKSLLIKVRQLPFYWRVNKIEFFQFLITSLSVIILDVDIGLGVGVCFYILSHIFRSTLPYSTTLGNIPGTELYKDVKLYKEAVEKKHIKIVRFQQEVHSTNAKAFTKAIHKLTGVDPTEYIQFMRKFERKKQKMESGSLLQRILGRKKDKISEKTPDVFSIGYDESRTNGDLTSNQFERFDQIEKQPPPQRSLHLPDDLIEERVNENIYSSEIQIGEIRQEDSESKSDEQEYDMEELNDMLDMGVTDGKELKIPKLHIKILIIDCSPINYIDTFGFKAIKSIIDEYNEIGVKVFLADLNDFMRDQLKKIAVAFVKSNEKVKHIDENIFFITIHDAVLNASREIAKNQKSITSK